MNLIEFIAKNEVSERQVGMLFLPGLTDIPERLNVPSRYFGLLLACDARQIADRQIIEVARSMLRQGMAYLCSWGPDCERVHDLFDLAIVENEPDETEESVRLTTWLKDLRLEQAIWHFLNVAFPAERYREDCQTELFIVIGEGAWASQMRMWVTDQNGLNERVLGKDDDETLA